ncbi:MAG: response regulator transcription factor [Planctomycetota bacterium]
MENALRLVIADDSQPIRERLIEMLSALPGIAVVGIASDAPEGLRLISTLHPDAVVLDLQMPGGGGFAVLEGIKFISPTPLVMVLTNFADEYYRAKSKAAGATYFFDKSAEFEDALGIFKDLGCGIERTAV